MLSKSAAAAIAASLSFALLPFSSASAADLWGGHGEGSIKDAPVAPAFSWTGGYIGVHGGYGWADWDGNLGTVAGCPGPCPDFDPANPPTPGSYTTGYVDSSRSVSDEGWFGGGQLGYNWQSGVLVFGLEADVSGGNLDASGGPYDTDPRLSDSVWSKKVDLSLDSFGTVRARLGYANGAVMPYVTGGLAWGKTSGDIAVTYTPNGHVDANANPAGTSYASVDETHVGWTIGAGVEWAFAPNWSLKAEYLHIDLGSEDYAFKGLTYTDAPFDTDNFKSELTVDTVKLGLNYRF